MKQALRAIGLLAGALAVFQSGPRADATAQGLPFAQSWTNIAQISLNDNWDGVPGIIGYRGDDATMVTGTDPQTLLGDYTNTPVDVNINQTNPNTFATGGVTEFELADPTIALNGSGTADAPFILISVRTTGYTDVRVAYRLRDLDASVDNATQQVALHYRVGVTGAFTNVPAAYVADATTASAATQVTDVTVLLPADAENQPLVQLRIMTTNAAGSDEWVGVDDIQVTGSTTNPTASGLANPGSVPVGGSTLLTVAVVPGITPASTGLTVVADLSAIGGLTDTAFLDDGVAPDASANAASPNGAMRIAVPEASAARALAVPACPGADPIESDRESG